MLGSLIYLFQEKLLFRASVLDQDYVYQFDHDFDELYLRPDAQTVINAIHFKSKDPKGVIIYFHGNAGDLSRWGTITEYFVDKHYDVLVMDYRGYGKSTGPLTEQALYKDAQFCYDHIKSHYSEDKIIVYGRSLGTGIATNLASNNTPKQLILESPFYNILDVARHRFPIFPIRHLIRYKLPSNEFISQVSCPIAIVHGTHDNVVPFSSGLKLFNVAPPQLTSFTKIKFGNHNDLIQFDDYHQLINTLLN